MKKERERAKKMLQDHIKDLHLGVGITPDKAKFAESDEMDVERRDVVRFEIWEKRSEREKSGQIDPPPGGKR